jgi:hypothetical protein
MCRGPDSRMSLAVCFWFTGLRSNSTLQRQPHEGTTLTANYTWRTKAFGLREHEPAAA